MEQEALKQTIEDILQNDTVGVMATVKHDKPYSRYMTFINKDLTLYTATNKATEKVEELQNNPNTHVILGYEGEGFGDEYVEYEGKVSISNESHLRDELWNPQMKHFFEGPDDPNFVILKLTPSQISLLNKQDMERKTLTLS